MKDGGATGYSYTIIGITKWCGNSPITYGIYGNSHYDNISPYGIQLWPFTSYKY